jgi:hypothetical protein
MAGVCLDFQGVLFIDFLTEQRTINAAYYSKRLKDRVKPKASVPSMTTLPL